MRGLQFTFVGAAAGAVLALLLGLFFGSGTSGDFVVFEFGIYCIAGMVVGGGTGCLIHVATKGSGRYEGFQPPPPTERKRMDKGTAVMTTLFGGIGMTAFAGFKMMNAPPAMQPIFIGALIGGIAGTIIMAAFILRNTKTGQ